MKGLNWIKDKKLISGGLGMVSDPRAQMLGRVAGLVGLGRRRVRSKTTRTMRGRGIFSGLGSIFG